MESSGDIKKTLGDFLDSYDDERPDAPLPRSAGWGASAEVVSDGSEFEGGDFLHSFEGRGLEKEVAELAAENAFLAEDNERLEAMCKAATMQALRAKGRVVTEQGINATLRRRLDEARQEEAKAKWQVKAVQASAREQLAAKDAEIADLYKKLSSLSSGPSGDVLPPSYLLPPLAGGVEEGCGLSHASLSNIPAAVKAEEGARPKASSPSRLFDALDLAGSHTAAVKARRGGVNDVERPATR